ncbi:uncharacterized protein (DUF952 family) [Stackebrandtia albiflava]|uniref:Uncharacterized protein (DUF952 family) n=1 Tax=Stackebrandtia albiflava TaxID=406432 RepID=A0A562VAA8_9ACTN|nr:DUF952 domain-containing protein [Stackebrandtia albiflava]TWJ14812.1 uncharacterized protein (DUF952 family) [Stackebrandtia albiflava]
MTILHFCTEADWNAAAPTGWYRHESLAKEGFIHFSDPYQVHLPADYMMRGRTDLVLLEVDENAVGAEVRYEPADPADPDSMRFPHLYGPLETSAVVAVHPFPPGPDGRFTLPPEVAR